MSRVAGAKGRDAKDSVQYLRRWLGRVKRFMGLGGCQVCGKHGWPNVRPEKLVFSWLIPDEEQWPVSRGPVIRGMTLARMRGAIRRSRLVCRGCVRGGLGRSLEDQDDGSVDVGRYCDPESGLRLDDLVESGEVKVLTVGPLKFRC